MNYIVFDLEWNQCPYGKNRENPRLPFEIIEIGAVKLDDEKNRIDEFHKIIRPVVYKRLHHRTREILNMNIKDLKKGEMFQVAVRKFLDWCGDDYMFCTWGNIDLIELQRNLKYYGLLRLMKGPIRYYDVQKLFSIQYEDKKSRKSLEYGVDHLGMDKSREFHHALDDAWYTAEVLKKLDDGIIKSYFSIDSYQNPKVKKDEIYIQYENYEKYISREFSSKEDAMKDREVVSSRCFLCRKKMRKKIRWFSINSKNYYCMAYCSEHGYLKGKIRMKKTDQGKFYVVKTIKRTDEQEMLKICQKRDAIKEKRKFKKNTAET